MTDAPAFRQLVALVVELRRAQRAYTRERTQRNLKAMWVCERRVDVWLAHHREEVADDASQETTD